MALYKNSEFMCPPTLTLIWTCVSLDSSLLISFADINCTALVIDILTSISTDKRLALKVGLKLSPGNKLQQLSQMFLEKTKLK